MVVIDATGCRSLRPFRRADLDPELCACSSSCTSPGPTAVLYGHSVHQARVRMGEQLAEQAPVEADMVMGVPESGVPAAEGFARAAASRTARAW